MGSTLYADRRPPVRPCRKFITTTGRRLVAYRDSRRKYPNLGLGNRVRVSYISCGRTGCGIAFALYRKRAQRHRARALYCFRRIFRPVLIIPIAPGPGCRAFRQYTRKVRAPYDRATGRGLDRAVQSGKAKSLKFPSSHQKLCRRQEQASKKSG